MGKDKLKEKKDKSKKEEQLDLDGFETSNGEENNAEISEESIDKFEEECEGKSTIYLIIKFIKTFRFKVGSNVNSIPIPVVFIPTKSILSYFSEGYQYSYNLLLNANNIENSLERQLQVYRYFLSTHYHCSVMQKPLNPVLGETMFQKFHVDLGNGIIEYENNLCFEQVSHHPPSFVAMIYNKNHGVRVTINYTLNMFFMGSYVKIQMLGNVIVVLEKFNETYEYTAPVLCGRFLRGFNEFCGESTLTLKSNPRYKIVANHIAKPLLGGDYDRLESIVIDTETNQELYNIYGSWSGEVKIKDLKKNESKHFYKRSDKSTAIKIIEDTSLETDTSNVWKGVFDAHHQGNNKAKSLEKRKVEKHQRQLAEERKKNNIEWKPKHFIKNGSDTWQLINY